MADDRLLSALGAVRKRVLAVGVAGGVGWSAVAVLAALLGFAWADLALDLAPGLRLACVCVALPLGAALLIRAGLLAYRAGGTRSVARRVDRVTGSGGQVLSGVDLLGQYGRTAAAQVSVAPGSLTQGLSAQMASIAVRGAADLAARVGAATAVPARPLVWPYASLGGLLVFLGVIAVAAPRLFATQWARFTDPYGDHPPYTAIRFTVEPGDTRIVYGSALDVRAAAEGGAVESVQLVFRPEGSAEESVPMFPESGGKWRATVSQVTAGGTYAVRSGKARSARYRFDLVTVPEFRDVRVRVVPPAYTHLPPYEGPVPDRGISGLAGTAVTFHVRSNRPLSAGSVELVPAEAPASRPAGPAPVVMRPEPSDPFQVTGTLTLSASGKLSVGISDTASQPCREPYRTSVTVVKDERPFVRILEPKENAFATPDAKLEVNLAAEDDYGISSLQLFRGLNESRATPQDVPVPPAQPRRLNASVPFDLSAYGLTPGDVIHFYARVEDNDPAGAKGSESPVVTVRIISNEDLNRMAVARDGLETLEAKYAMAGRLMENLDDQIARLQDELKKLPPDSPLAEAKRQKLKELADKLKEAAGSVDDAAKNDLPFDIDKQFRDRLADVARSLKDAAADAEALAQSGTPSGKAAEKLGDIRKKLGGRRDQFRKEVGQPMQNLDEVFPLVLDQERFVEIWQRQQDLATRLKSIADVKPDDPKAKARMRDLETEQRQIVQDLNELLDDIKKHAIELPVITGPLARGAGRPAVTLASALAGVLAVEDPQSDADALRDNLEQLRQTALRFVERVRASGALDQMNGAAADLGAFDPAHAADKAQAAADTLKTFIEEARGMQGNLRGLGPMIFRPSIVKSMDQTIDELLKAAGMDPGYGTGASGGFSQRRSSLKNLSLYGRIPSRSRAGGSQASRNVAGPGASGGAGTDGPGDRGGNPGATELRAAGERDVPVPPHYKQKVGEYFQRVADELGDD